MTNYERIKSYTKEELSEYLVECYFNGGALYKDGWFGDVEYTKKGYAIDKRIREEFIQNQLEFLDSEEE